MTALRHIDITGRTPPDSVAPGPAPDLRWIALSDLVIDDAYQRPLLTRSWKSINAIAKAFRWSQFSTVLVAPVPGGKYAIVDGQHRCHAAMLCGIEEVPCQITLLDRGDQAAAFAAVNSQTVAITSWAIYRAAIEAGEPWAIAARDAVAAGGATLMTNNKTNAQKQPREVYCVRFIDETVRAGHAPALIRALEALCASESGRDDPALWSFAFLRPWVMAIAARPLLKPGAGELGAVIDGFDIYDAEDRITRVNRSRAAEGAKKAPKHILMKTMLGAALDERFPGARASAPVAEVV